jgi:modulator of FtsH protease HflC
MKPRGFAITFVAGLFLLAAITCSYTVKETETAIVTRFGRPVGEPKVNPGLYFKLPVIETVTKLEKRVLEWDGPAVEMPTKDKTYIQVDAFARWRIAEPSKFFVALKDLRSAQSRLEDIIGSEMRAAVARHELIEVIRSDKSRVLKADPQNPGTVSGSVPVKIQRGRTEIERDVLQASAPKLVPLGLELIDVRIKRVNYNSAVLARIYQRMMSERQQIAQRFRSEGEGEAARIGGKKERDLSEVQSNAYKKVQQLQGEADAEATRIYAAAFNKSAEAAEFYGFIKTLETYKKILGPSTSLMLSTDSDIFSLLKKASSRSTPPPLVIPVEKKSAPAPVVATPPAPVPAPPIEATPATQQ